MAVGIVGRADCDVQPELRHRHQLLPGSTGEIPPFRCASNAFRLCDSAFPLCFHRLFVVLPPPFSSQDSASPDGSPPQAEYSNLKNRPIGIGVQGLADTFMELRLPYESAEAKLLNKDIFETLYFAALSQSKDLAKRDGTYDSYLHNGGCPVSKGVLQPDMWDMPLTDRWDWASLRAEIAEHGVRNSLLLAPMPTASTAQILGNNESFEPYTSNMYNRRVLSGEFTVVNKYLLKDLTKLGLWPKCKNQLIAHNGSVQKIPGVSEGLKELYKTAEHDRHGRRPRGVYRSKPEPEHLHGGAELRQADEHALLLLAEGAEDGHVLLADQGGGRRDQVHRRHQGAGERECRDQRNEVCGGPEEDVRAHRQRLQRTAGVRRLWCVRCLTDWMACPTGRGDAVVPRCVGGLLRVCAG